MSKAVYVCFNDPRLRFSLKEDLKTIARRIMPDNISPAPLRIAESDGVIYGVINPSAVTREKEGGLMLGQLFQKDDRWWVPGTAVPDGSFAIFRSNAETVEVLTDVVASRSVWYYQDDSLFIASTSQRAITVILKSFSLNRQVLPWILSSGGLGFGNAWDSRVKLAPADTALVLDRRSWSLSVRRNPVPFTPADRSDKEHEEVLKQAFRKTFGALEFDFSKWVLPLSGGYDSRSILCLMNHFGGGVENLKALTWGLGSARDQPGNDAYVARKVAAHFRIDHQYFPTDRNDDSAETVLNRFLVCGEGRIDHVGGYMDGFRIWKTLYENNVYGIIRGDEGFGYPPVDSASHVRKLLGTPLCDDYVNLKNYEEFGLPRQELHEDLKQKDSETLSTWRDRLYHEFRIPIVLAALTDLKLPFVEIANPLLSRNLILQVRSLPDHLRTDKILFKKIADSLSPRIPYATSSATESTSNILRSPGMVALIRAELSSPGARELFSAEFLELLLDNLKVDSGSGPRKRGLKGILASLFKRFAPRWLHLKFVRKIQNSPTLSYNLLAFRACIASRMSRMLSEDAGCMVGNQPQEQNEMTSA